MSAASPVIRSLYEAARADAPGSDERDAMWSRVALATSAAAGVAVASVATPALAAPAGEAGGPTAPGLAAASSGALTTKLLVLGGVIGACGTALGAIVTLLLVEPSSPVTESSSPSPPTGWSSSAVTSPGASPRARVAAPGARRADPGIRQRNPQGEVHAVAPAIVASAALAPPGAEASAASDLAEEARLLTEARAALVRAEPERALSLVQATRRIHARSLEPEALVLEGRALRALGRADEAAVIELGLKRRFPDSALAH